jgi:hypothetical protein
MIWLDNKRLIGGNYIVFYYEDEQLKFEII